MSLIASPEWAAEGVYLRPLVGMQMTADEFEISSDTSGLELLDGVVQQKPMSEVAGYIQGLVYAALLTYTRERSGRAYPDGTDYRCFGENANRVRKPDASFIAADRVQPLRRKACRVVPDLAVEVVSPTDNLIEFNDKLADYEAAGVRLVWVVDPFTRIVRVIDHAADEERTLGENDTLTGGEVLPGFEAAVADFLVDPSEMEPKEPKS